MVDKNVFEALNRVVRTIEVFNLEEQVEMYDFAIKNLAAMKDFKEIILREYRKAGVEKDA